MKNKQRICSFAMLMILSTVTGVSLVYGDVTPLYPPIYFFYGYVRDDLGNAIPGATVQAQNNIASTDQNGYYTIDFTEPYSGPINASKTGYFAEKTTAATVRGPTQVDFSLTRDAETWVTTMAVFPNTPLAYMEHTQSSTHTITVKSYAGGSGQTTTLTQEIATGIASYYPKSFKRRADATGIYRGSGELLDLFIRHVDDVWSEFYEQEYIDKNQVVGDIIGVLPGPPHTGDQELSGSLTLQGGLKTTVGCSILGVTVSVELESTMAVTSTLGDKIHYELNNDSPDYRYWFKVYFESLTIPHIWFLNREYVGPPPGGGGCPYAWAWNGSSYVLDNNILPTSERYTGTDVEDYYKLEQSLIPRDGKYSLQISEFEHEDSYIDHVGLLAVDHDSDVKIAVDPNGQILTYKNPYAPIYAIDNSGNNRLNEIRQMDGDVSNPATFFYGNANDYLILNFGHVNSDSAKLILRDDMKCDEICIDVQVLRRSGQWQTVATLTPRSYWAVEGVDLSQYVSKNRDLEVRLLWTSPHRLDYVGLDTTRQADYEINYATLVSAAHSTQGDVQARLTAKDNIYVELVPGQEIQLDFTLPDNQREARTYIFYTEGRYYTIP